MPCKNRMVKNMKQERDTTSSDFDFTKAMVAADGIRHTFTLKRGVDLHPDQWDHIVYHLIKDALLEPLSMIIAPNNRPYLHVYVPSRDEIEIMIKESDGVTCKNFAGVCETAVNSYAGLALYANKNQQNPDMTMRFGALYSYLNYGDAGGPAQLVDNMARAIRINPQNPKQAIADQNDMTFEEGEPSEAFLNDFIRACMRQELRKYTGNQNLEVGFLLRQQYMYAMRHMIVVTTSQPIGTQDEIHQLMQGLTWYMPLLLPLAYTQEDGYMDIYY